MCALFQFVVTSKSMVDSFHRIQLHSGRFFTSAHVSDHFNSRANAASIHVDPDPFIQRVCIISILP
jgi:hypothetical protein